MAEFTLLEIYVDGHEEPVQIYQSADANIAGTFNALVNAGAPMFWLQCAITSRRHLFNLNSISHISESLYENRAH
jgi:hypothetical protein